MPHPDAPPQSPPSSRFSPALQARSPLRAAISAACRIPEPQAVAALLPLAEMPPSQAERADTLARQLAQTLRDRDVSAGRAGLVQSLLQEFALSSQEGVALMCLAEALLRIPDAATRDALIRDKLHGGQWQAHLGHSPSLFVNAATWGLLLTGKLVGTHSETGLGAALGRLIGKGGEPLIRKGVDAAMRMMGEQFVMGETITQALRNARDLEALGYRYSYDMLGEAALTAADAQRYTMAYEQAIRAIGAASAGRGIYLGPGISIKLSALHPRYSRAQYERVHDELYPTLLRLVLIARDVDIGLNIDAEESPRLELSLDLLERLCAEPKLAGWNGIGFVIQAYQKRCPYVVDCLVDLARRSGRRLMIRLVKGAYWDSEIKQAQIDGLDGYPVYTRKAHTDLGYLACARKLLAVPDAVYPQFATHNAHTLAAIYQMAGPASYQAGQYEFQCLHGMGEPLYEQVVGPQAQGKLDRPCRIYAPVGTHETLLAYLVRRLLENGANTSFVNRIADSTIAIADLVRDPVRQVLDTADREDAIGLPHPAIPLPVALYGSERVNARGLDLASEPQLRELAEQFARDAAYRHRCSPMLDGGDAPDRESGGDDEIDTVDDRAIPILNPSNPQDIVGLVREAEPAQIEAALRAAVAAAPTWAGTAPAARGAVLEAAAALIQQQMPILMGLLIREAGKTCANATSELRESIDFLRYYAAQVRSRFDNDTHLPLGPVVSISPWNFPAAIFTGQIAAALAAGNVVLAKPAEQTPLIAARIVRLLWRAGVPRGALQLLPGRGETVGAALVADPRVHGVLFTGSTDVARLLQRSIANRLNPDGQPVALIAETGGQNAMIVDSSALLEQVVGDAIHSAFDSAGQRCSALRVLCVQQDIADAARTMLLGAMEQLRVGDPAELATDVGPVIDRPALDAIERHLQAMRARGHRVHQADSGIEARQRHADATFMPPTLIEIDSLSELKHEVFGPVLHLLRYRREDLGSLLDRIAATGYGLTLGLHTRIDETIARVTAGAPAGNVYVNRNMVGAVVGVQPFGGDKLSGTGPKAGGPLYLFRLLAAMPHDAPLDAIRALGAAEPGATAGPGEAFESFRQWAFVAGQDAITAQCRNLEHRLAGVATRVLKGPTGERNHYSLRARCAVLCLAADDADRFAQLAAVLAVGARAIWPLTARGAWSLLPAPVQNAIELVSDWSAPEHRYELALHHGADGALPMISRALAARPGPLVTLVALAAGATAIPLERLFVERSLSINTTAAGGNASLMTIG